MSLNSIRDPNAQYLPINTFYSYEQTIGLGGLDVKGDFIIEGKLDIEGDLEVKGDTILGGDLDIMGNVTIENSNPLLSINNNGNNINRSTLLLNGNTVTPLSGLKIQQNQTGSAIIENFDAAPISILTHSDGAINITPNGLGNVNIGSATGLVSISNPVISSSSVAANSILRADGTKNIVSSTLTNGQLLIGNTGNTPSSSTLTAGSNIAISNGAGTITITGGLNTIFTTTVTLTFGGGSTGITYDTNTIEYHPFGNMVFFNVNILLTNKGSSTGTAIIAMPFLCKGTGPNQTITINYTENLLAGVTDPTSYSGIWAPGTAQIGLYNTNMASGLLDPLRDANFTNTSRVNFMGWVIIQ